jgi:hypothetical protein
MIVSAILSLLLSSPSAASCGAAGCPADTMTLKSTGARWLEAGYEFEFVPQKEPRVGGSPAAVGQVRGHHDEVFTLSRVHRFRLAWAPDEKWTLEASMPYVWRSHEHVHHHRGADLVETWNVSGAGDAQLSARRVVWAPGPKASLLAGVKFPTGDHHERNADGEEAESPVQPGTGSWDFTAGASLTGKILDRDGFLSATYRFNGRGDLRYRVGDVFQAHAGVAAPVWSRLAALGQVTLRVNRQDDKGQTSEEIGKTGGTYVFVSPGLEWRSESGWGAFALIHWPAYQWVYSEQIVARWAVSTGVSYRWAL